MTTTGLNSELRRYIKFYKNDALLVIADVGDVYYSVTGYGVHTEQVYLLLSGRENPAIKAGDLLSDLETELPMDVYIKKSGSIYGVIGVRVGMGAYLILETQEI